MRSPRGCCKLEETLRIGAIESPQDIVTICDLLLTTPDLKELVI